MAEKKTKRLGFNFLRSYFDVFNELKEDADKLSFVTAIFNKSFLNEDPEKPNFMVNLCYQSQKHAIEKSVKGWISANKTDLQGSPLAPPKGDPKGDPPPPSGQVQGEGEGQEEGKEEKKESVIFLQNIHDTFLSCLNFFPEHLHPKTEIQKNKWLETIDKLIRLDNIPENLIIEIVKKTREDDFWSSNFLAIPKLRKKNKEGVKYIVVFNEQFKTQKNGKQETTNKLRELSKSLREGQRL